MNFHEVMKNTKLICRKVFANKGYRFVHPLTFIWTEISTIRQKIDTYGKECWDRRYDLKTFTYTLIIETVVMKKYLNGMNFFILQWIRIILSIFC